MSIDYEHREKNLCEKNLNLWGSINYCRQNSPLVSQVPCLDDAAFLSAVLLSLQHLICQLDLLGSEKGLAPASAWLTRA